MQWLRRAALGASFLVFLGQAPALAQSTDVSWAPGAVTAEVTAGGTGFVEVELSAETALIGALLEVSPSLRSFAGAAPANLGDLGAGETRTVTLGFGTLWDDLPSESFTVTGTLRVLADSGGSPVALLQELPITLTVVPLPPDPGEAGKATLEGIDSDGDGLRDDIQRYIAFTFANSPSVRAAAAAYAKKVQETFFVGNDRVKAVNLAADVQRTRHCFDFLFGGQTVEDLLRSHRATGALLAEVLNTEIRSRSYLAYDAQLAGGVYPVLPESEWKKGCSFDPDALPN